MREILFRQLAKYYDTLYSFKNYKRDVDFLEEIFKEHRVKVRDILDVACGTGNHATLLVKRGYNVVGVDLYEKMLEIARKKVRNAKFIKCDMRNLRLNQTFDAVICMFSSITYNLTLSELGKTLSGFHKHLKTGGVVVFDTLIKAASSP